MRYVFVVSFFAAFQFFSERLESGPTPCVSRGDGVPVELCFDMRESEEYRLFFIRSGWKDVQEMRNRGWTVPQPEVRCFLQEEKAIVSKSLFIDCIRSDSWANFKEGVLSVSRRDIGKEEGDMLLLPGILESLLREYRDRARSVAP